MDEQKKLIPWDGTCEKTDIRYKSFSPLWKDENGTIWYKDSEGKLCIWCAAERLFSHLCRLRRLGLAE
jgi:hypothetical protein